jgi:hypothetical protein
LRILFFCGSLEPGKDGVGDYTRRLSGELIRQGHTCGIVAIMDKDTNQRTEELQVNDLTTISVLRLPYSNGYELNCIDAKPWVNTFNPDWISLQYVPFSFHHKGLPFKLSEALQPLVKGKKVQLMFHELWVGISVNSPLKHKVIGYFQRYIANQLLQKLGPRSIVTSNVLYQLVLKSGGIDADILSLFSNIPKAHFEQEFKNELLIHLKVQEDEFHKYLYLGVFGSIYPEANIEKVLNELLVNSNETNKSLVFISFGRIGSDGTLELERLKTQFSGRIHFINLGELTQERVSTLLQLLDFGISCTPLQHLGKSGVFAAMKLHGLEVIISSKEVIPEYEDQLIQLMPEFMQRPTEMWGVEYVAKKYILLMDN